ncbi:beta family protein [Afifella sp. IM 167]|uniref:beta family protein n=1 Tax=Afifella sp. IM 167 TaxID=2033586 RepID=UPI001CC9B2A1|nr:beta family protein [Afifella sp. IM 167]MBZ8132893.1 hypothetical protein [Afifella sp. IM 167]
MLKVDLTRYHYLPCLQLSEPEQIGYSNLSDEDKDAILPIIELSQVKNEASFDDTLSATTSMIGDLSFVLDLSKDRAPPAFVPKQNPDYAKIERVQEAQNLYNQALTSLLAPDDGFANWRQLVEKFPKAVPVLQFTDLESQDKQVLRQASQLAKAGFEHLALRITQETNEAVFATAGQVAAILDSPLQLLLIIDCGQGRQRIAERAEFAKLAIARVMEEMEPSQTLQLNAVCVSDSYTQPPDGTPRLYESHSWELWRQASETFPFLFGDYGAHYRLKKASTYMPGDWRAQVVYSLREGWITYKHPNAQDPQGWIEGAKKVLGDSNCDKENDCWGSQLLEAAESGNIEGASSARFWHGAKINMHIHRQIRYAEEVMGGSE